MVTWQRKPIKINRPRTNRDRQSPAKAPVYPERSRSIPGPFCLEHTGTHIGRGVRDCARRWRSEDFNDIKHNDEYINRNKQIYECI